jgi:hypothetical protein
MTKSTTLATVVPVAIVAAAWQEVGASFDSDNHSLPAKPKGARATSLTIIDAARGREPR